MTDENRLVDPEVVEQPDEIAGQVLDIIGFDGFGPVGRPIAALIRRDHPNSGIAQRLDLVAPRKRDLRPAVAENNRRRVGFRACFVIAHADAIRLGKLQRWHFQHRDPLNQLAALVRSGGGANAACSATNSPGSMSQRTCTWGMMLAPAMKPKSSWSR